MATDKMADKFHWLDYLLFALTIVVALGIGIIFALKGRKKNNTEEYLMGSRNLQLLPVAISILVSLTTSFGILGTPAETYAFGTQFYLHVVSASLGCLLGAVLFVPIFYPLKPISAFEYLEVRFESVVPRIIGTINSLINNIFVMGLSLYAPSNAFNAVTGFPIWLSIVITAIVGTVYTLVGGMKAVIWTDVFQSIIIFIGLFVVVAVGVAEVGGFQKVWDINDQWQRLIFFDMNPDPRAGSTFWSVVVAMTFLWMAVIATQPTVQRYCALPTMRLAKISVLLNIPGFIIVGLLTCMCGSVAFAYYAGIGCDPLTGRTIKDEDINKVFPIYVADVIGHAGLPGIFIACLYAGSLSTISSLLNCSAAIVWEDLLKPKFYYLKESKQTLIAKVVVLVSGVLSIGFAFVTQQMEGSFIGMTYTVVGTTLGPVVGMMIAGALIPRASNIMTIVGATIGFVLSFWMAVGANARELYPVNKPFPIHTCPELSGILNNTALTPIEVAELLTVKNVNKNALDEFYSVSFLYYPIISIIVTLIFAFISAFIPRLRMGPTPINLLFPFMRSITRRCCPQHITEEEEKPVEISDTNKSSTIQNGHITQNENHSENKEEHLHQNGYQTTGPGVFHTNIALDTPPPSRTGGQSSVHVANHTETNGSLSTHQNSVSNGYLPPIADTSPGPYVTSISVDSQ